MLKILINAYACSPDMGSEPGMAWNWIGHLAKFCELYIITEGEFRDRIDSAVAAMPYGRNMHFYYNPVPKNVRRMCWNQGDWRFYWHYRKWQWKTYLLAMEICSSVKIDVLHQLNMIGFREPGYLWKLSRENGIPFVWGPIGGLKQFPTHYLENAGIKMQVFMRIKNTLNVLQLKYDRRVDEALKTAKLLISSIPESRLAIRRYKGLKSVVIPETGCFLFHESSIGRFNGRKFRVLWVGKFDFRKQLALALRSVATANNLEIVLDVYGTGSVKQVLEAETLAKDLGIAQLIVWHGNQENEVVQKAMRESHLFFFTSVNEDTSTVVLEAVSNGLPVLCFDTCGMSAVIDSSVGRKINLTTPSQSVREFAGLLNQLEGNRKLLKQMSDNCRRRSEELSWENKAQKMMQHYEMVIQDNKQNDMMQITPPE